MKLHRIAVVLFALSALVAGCSSDSGTASAIGTDTETASDVASFDTADDDAAVTPDGGDDTGSDDAATDTSEPDASDDTTADAASDASSDVPEDTAPDAVADAAPDTPSDATDDDVADVTDDGTSDAAPDVTPDASPDVAPDAEPDATLETCGDIEAAYLALVAPPQVCDGDDQCQLLNGHCGVGLGGCYYPAAIGVNQGQLDDLSRQWTALSCELGRPVCRCAAPPEVVCDDGVCAF